MIHQNLAQRRQLILKQHFTMEEQQTLFIPLFLNVFQQQNVLQPILVSSPQSTAYLQLTARFHIMIQPMVI